MAPVKKVILEMVDMKCNCYGCAKTIQKAIKKMSGVERVSVSVDTKQVVVDGTTDVGAAALKAWLEKKLNRPVTIVSVTIVSDSADPPPPTETDNVRPPPPDPPQSDPYSGGNPTTTYDPRYMPNDGPATFSEENPNVPHYYPYGSGNPTTTYDPRYMPNDAPSTFSDENPNACSIQ